jgi:hypothetical protein
MITRMLTLYAACLVVSGCAVEPADPSFAFEGTITSREPFYGAAAPPGTGIDTLPAMLVEADPGSPADPLCANTATFFLRDVKRLAFANGAPARLDDLSVGARVRVWWDGSQLDSCPPKRRADMITILS